MRWDDFVYGRTDLQGRLGNRGGANRSALRHGVDDLARWPAVHGPLRQWEDGRSREADASGWQGRGRCLETGRICRSGEVTGLETCPDLLLCRPRISSASIELKADQAGTGPAQAGRSEEHTSELQSPM